MPGSRIVLTTLGSLGDLHPYMAIAIELLHRGHAPVLATSELYREKVEREGLEFSPIAPDLADFGDEAVFMAKVMDAWRGSKYVIQEVVLPFLDRTYADLYQATNGADLLIGHPLTYAVPLVAEKRSIRWLGTALQPSLFLSAHDPPVLGPLGGLAKLPLKAWFYRPLFRMMKKLVRGWAKPIDRLREREGLGPSPGHPLLDDVYSPHGNLALFSPILGPPQTDWPAKTMATGFPFYDIGMEAKHSTMTPELERFLDAGPPPIAFTLGSSAVMTAGNFYRESFRAAQEAGFRAVLLIGRAEWNRPLGDIPSHICIDDYAPYSLLFPRCAAVFHQGGVGTTGQVMQAGKPMVIVPFSHDQPDHAHRIEKLKIGAAISRKAYRADRVIETVRRILHPDVVERAKKIGERIRHEQGVEVACDFIESVLS